MRLSPFEIHTPATLVEAGDLMERLGDDAVLYAGGTELLLVMKLGFADYGNLVDVKGVAELHRLVLEGSDLVVGGSVTHRALERSPVLAEHWPELARMEHGVANVRVRGAGTLGGNLAFADPHSDPATFLLAAGATIEVWGRAGARSVPMDRFVLGPYQTALRPGEIITAIRIPLPGPGSATAHRKIAFHERPAATVTCIVQVDPAGAVTGARIAVGSVGLVPMRLEVAEQALCAAGTGPVPEAVQSAAHDGCAPTEDSNGAVDYKRHLVGVLVRRAATEALDAAREGRS
jgi:carbon-monoxide dehydrogenase medium subunit